MCEEVRTLVCSFSGSGERKQCRFLEVKSPNDRLSDKQRIWLHVLQNLGADVGICNVATSGARAPPRLRRPSTGADKEEGAAVEDDEGEGQPAVDDSG